MIDRRLEALETFEYDPVYSTANVSSPPTDAQLDSAFGTASDLYTGFVGLLDDNGAGTTVWLCYVVNGAWFYEQLTKAV